MKLLLLSGIFPPDIGGPATYMSRLARKLEEDGHKVVVLTTGETGHEVSPKDSSRVIRISRRVPVLLRMICLCLLAIWYGAGSDVIYCNALDLPGVVVGRLLRKRVVLKIVGDYAWERACNLYDVRDTIDDFQTRRYTWKIELNRAIRAWTVRRATGVITPSEYLRRLVITWGASPNVVKMIPNAHDTAVCFDPLTRHRGQGIHVVTVARLVRWKGIATLIDVMKQMHPSVQLTVVGDGPERHQLEEKAKSLGDRVRFTGAIDRDSVMSLLLTADVFVLNTGYEGFPHSVLEAFACGSPVITTRVCGNPEVVRDGETGILVSYDQVEELRDSLGALLQAPDRRANLARTAAQELYRWKWSTIYGNTVAYLRTVDK